jgi:phosphatidylserine/phosphatidylglycerophosphate/cardiolipin synthase-like enzyme
LICNIAYTFIYIKGFLKTKEQKDFYMPRRFLSIIAIIFLLSTSISFGSIEVLFSPDDKPTEKLVTMLDDAKKKVLVAIYMLTEPRIVKAIVNAKKRGLFVEVVTDKISTEGSYGKANILAQNSIDVFVYKPIPKHSSKSNKVWDNPGIMHNKFAIIDNQVWTGSFNWTFSANWKNQENIIITDDKKTVDRYKEHFVKLKTRCAPYEKTPITNKEQTQLMKFLNLLKEKLGR